MEIYSSLKPYRVRLDKIDASRYQDTRLTVTVIGKDIPRRWTSPTSERAYCAELLCPWDKLEEFQAERARKRDEKQRKQRDEQARLDETGERIRARLSLMGFKENSAFRCKRKGVAGRSHPQFVCDWKVMEELLAHHPLGREAGAAPEEESALAALLGEGYLPEEGGERAPLRGEESRGERDYVE